MSLLRVGQEKNIAQMLRFEALVVPSYKEMFLRFSSRIKHRPFDVADTTEEPESEQKCLQSTRWTAGIRKNFSAGPLGLFKPLATWLKTSKLKLFTAVRLGSCYFGGLW